MRSARRIRRGWKDVSKGTIPAGFPYRCFAPGAGAKRDSKRFIDIFFYDAPLSTDVSFNHLLRNGDGLADAIALAYPRGGNDLVVVATDGEIYGHHEPFADMALSYLVDSAAPRRGLAMTNFGAYLDAHEPRFEVELKPGPNGEGTAWSCFHGVGRWKEDCGDSAGGAAGHGTRNGARRCARGSTRSAEALAAQYEKRGVGALRGSVEGEGRLHRRHRGIAPPRRGGGFVAAHAAAPLSGAETARALSLLESQRNAQLMFTSCGWFFSDISGIETVQIMRYAARAIELAGTDHWLSSRRSSSPISRAR